MRKLTALVLTLCVILLGTAVAAQGETQVTLICDGTANYKLEAEERDADFDGNYVFAKYFAGGTQADMLDGIKNLIAEGAASINGFALPCDAQSLAGTEDGELVYIINGAPGYTAQPGASQ